ncbi:MAG: hydrogenase maturation nickel metallochaperone HypA [Candidatus Omnitrophota bacterium]
MHEIAIIEGLVDLVEKQRAIHSFSKVLEIRVACGIYNCASEENLNFCLGTLSKGTCLEGAVVKVVRLPERWQCSSCESPFEKSSGEDQKCPRCGASTVLPLLNSEIYLDKLEVD